MLSFRQLEAFRAVMLSGSISAASQQLRVAQPTVTKMIRRLEDVLGVELFERSGGRLTPTRVALRIFEAVNPSISGIERLSDTVVEIAAGRIVAFRLGASPSVSQALAPRALRLFAETRPGGRLRMDTLSLRQAREYVLLAEGDCAVTIFPISDPLIASRKIARIGMVCLIPVDHPLAAHDGVTISDIADAPLVFFHPDTPHGRLVIDMFQAQGRQPNIAIETRFAETAPQLMREGFGIAIVDEATALGVADPAIRIAPLVGAPDLAVYLHHRKDLGAQATIEALADALLRAAGELGLETCQPETIELEAGAPETIAAESIAPRGAPVSG